MKKFLSILILSFLFLINVNAEDRKSELDKLFYELKNAKDLSSAQAIEIKIAKIWDKHPSDDRRGFRLTELLYQGSVLINSGELNKAYKLYTQIIAAEPDWAEAWNRRATVLYLMEKYESSLEDIEITLKFEPRHFGALDGMGLIFIHQGQYQQAIDVYDKMLEIFPFSFVSFYFQNIT